MTSRRSFVPSKGVVKKNNINCSLYYPAALYFPPINHKHNKTIEAYKKHHSVLKHTELRYLYKNGKRNRPEQKQKIRQPRYLRQSHGQKEKGQRRCGTGKTSGKQHAGVGVPDQQSDQRINKNKNKPITDHHFSADIIFSPPSILLVF
jgi:hypothetical protein